MSLFKCLLLPHFVYCCEIFVFGLDGTCKRVLSKLFNACVRFYYGLKRSDSLERYRNKIRGCGIIEYMKMRAPLCLHKAVLNKTPPYISQKIQPGHSSRTNSLDVPYSFSAKTHTTLLSQAISKYNALPRNVKRARTVDEFRGAYFDSILGV